LLPLLQQAAALALVSVEAMTNAGFFVLEFQRGYSASAYSCSAPLPQRQASGRWRACLSATTAPRFRCQILSATAGSVRSTDPPLVRAFDRERRHAVRGGLELEGRGPGFLLPVAHAYETCILVCMRTTLDIDESLLMAAMEAAGMQSKTRVIELALERLVQAAARERIAAMHGTIRKAKAPARRRAGKLSA
jgi:Arc/MetJ family transcription regulator